MVCPITPRSTHSTTAPRSAIVELLYDAYETLGDARYFESVRRGVDALLAMQGRMIRRPGPSSTTRTCGPSPRARTNLPVTSCAKVFMSILMLAGVLSAHGRYALSRAGAACLDWFDRINRDAAAAKYPRPRYWEPVTNKPVYVVRTQELTAEGYGKYIWTTDPAKARCDGQPCRQMGKPSAMSRPCARSTPSSPH